MKTKLMIATHGNFAKGIIDSLEMIAGKQKDITTICAYTEQHVDYSQLFEQLVTQHDYETSRLVVVTDLLGGSVNNEFMKYQGQYPFTLIAGLNLSLLLELALASEDLTKEYIQEVVTRNKDYIVICEEHMFETVDDNDF